MGEKKRKMTRIEKFKGKHPYCCLCGGKRQTETIEHAPPKVIFWDKLRLQGMEVPACKRCNNGTGAEDQLAAFFAIMQSPSFYGSSNNEKMLDYFTKLMAGCKNNVPGFSTLFTDSGNVLLESKGIIQTHNKLTFKPELFTKHLKKWAAKQALAH